MREAGDIKYNKRLPANKALAFMITVREDLQHTYIQKIYTDTVSVSVQYTARARGS